ncbi:hypothetical protein L1049_021911 [Liquidambar formosana]|uniref:Uncharacterized protein n=1 Tax=Liquidambar formosana TaxID=63359 RepID=A0AAP0WQB6_LIQFO
MEDKMVSAISNSRLGILVEDSSSDTEINSWQSKKRQRDILSAPLKIFKGVVLQKNGTWGAQIYNSGQRFWLGTFQTQKEAAMAYDIVAIKLNRDSYCNFTPTILGMREKIFQSYHSFEDILKMIKDGTYQSIFMDFITIQSFQMQNEAKGIIDISGVLFQPLFHKELTPSDVGKLNRCVIPKKHAMAHFPPVANIRSGGDSNGGNRSAVQLTLQDKNLKTWNFTYCYWKSSQSFVITKGWYKFVREKGLKEKDVIVFYGSEGGGMLIMNHVKCVADERNGRDSTKQPGVNGKMEDGSDGDAMMEREMKKRFKLFGVEIN